MATTTSSTTSTALLGPEQKELLAPVIPIAKEFLANPPKLFPDRTVQPFTPLEIGAQQSALQAAGAITPNINQSIDFSTFLQGPSLNPATNPALQAATDAAIRPLTQQFEQSIIPSIGNAAELAGQRGSSRQGVAEGIASQSLLQQIGDTSATFQNEAFQSSLDAAVKALIFSPQTLGQAFLPSQITGSIGEAQRGLQTAQVGESADRFLAEQIIPFAAAQDVASLAFGFPGGGGTSTSAINQPGGTSPLSGALGGALLGSQVGPAFGAGADTSTLLGALAGLGFGIFG